MKQIFYWSFLIVLIFMANIIAMADSSNDTSVSYSTEDISDGIVHLGLVGYILSTEGIPINLASITPTSLDHDSQPIPEIFITSNDEGFYHWPLLPGRYQITVKHNDFQAKTKEITLKEDHQVRLNFILSHQ